LKTKGIQRRTKPSVVATLLTVLALFGCSDTQRLEATGKSAIRGINALVDSPELTFLIEERGIGGVAFKSVQGFAKYDDLTYNFNFDVLLTGDTEATRIGSQFIDVVVDHEYTIVLTGSYDNPSISFWEEPERVFDGSETIFEMDFAHLAASQGAIDVYLAAVGTIPTLGEEIGSLNFGERIPYREFTDGIYDFIVTPKGLPGTILFQSNGLISTPATRVTLAIFDSDPSLNADLAVSLLNPAGGSAALFDINKPAQLRLLHAAFGTNNIDGYLDSDFSSAAFPDVAFGEVSNYIDIDSSLMPLTITPTGNSGAPIFEQGTASILNSRSTIIFGGDPGTPIFLELIDEARPIARFPVIRVSNLSVNAGPINIYMIEPGTTIDMETVGEFAALPYPFDTGFFGPAPGMVELVITRFSDTIPISVPLPLTMQNGDMFDVVVLDTADPNVIEAVLFDSTLVSP
jgi:hypothetical protein